MMDEPSPANHYQAEHAGLLLDSYYRLTGRYLMPPCLERKLAARELYQAPFVVLSHDTAADPLFTYANLAAQRLFEMPWGEIVGLPSRHSAGPMEQRARQQSLDQVARQGFMDHYQAVRVSRGGKRFLILDATIWNLTGADGQPMGQAATFGEWRDLPDDAVV
jgi:hypothetical protein